MWARGEVVVGRHPSSKGARHSRRGRIVSCDPWRWWNAVCGTAARVVSYRVIAGARRNAVRGTAGSGGRQAGFAATDCAIGFEGGECFAKAVIVDAQSLS